MHNAGEIIVAPGILHWFYAPDSVDTNFRVEVLQEDLFIHPAEMSDLETVRSEKDKGSRWVFFNLDRYLRSEHARHYPPLTDAPAFFAQFEGIPSKHILFHTDLINPKLEAIFKHKGYILLSRNLSNPKTARGLILNFLKRLHENDQRQRRSQIRIQFYPDTPVKVEMQILGTDFPNIKAHLKDVSNNGVGIIFNDPTDMDNIGLKRLVRLKIGFRRMNVYVQQGVVARLSREKQEIGVFFDPHKPTMISYNDASNLAQMIHEWLEDVISAHGYSRDLDNFNVPL